MLELRPAGIPARLYAFALDLLVRLAVIYGVSIVLVVSGAFVVLGGLGTAILLIAIFLLEWFYPVVFELWRGGATPGKQLLGLKVVMDTGLPVTPAASITRNLLRTADFLPLLYGAAIVCMLMRKDFKRLGDLAAGTCVVYRLERAKPVDLGNVPPQPPAIALGRREQAAVVAFAARMPRLTQERADELATLAAPVVGASGNGDVRARLLAVAQWLVGKR
jgi:uncharacterized RDD family membrane protein YckC